MVQKTAGAEGRFGGGPTGQREYGRVASGSRNRAPWQTQMEEEEEDTAKELERLLCLRLAFVGTRQGEWRRIISPSEWH